MPALRIMIVEDDPVLSGLLGGLVAAEMQLVMLYCEIIALSNERPCLRNALRRQFEAHRPQAQTLDALANTRGGACVALH